MRDLNFYDRHWESAELILEHPVARMLGPEPPEDMLNYRTDEHLQRPGTVDETGFSDGGVV
jgi:hypothetical protein